MTEFVGFMHGARDVTSVLTAQVRLSEVSVHSENRRCGSLVSVRTLAQSRHADQGWASICALLKIQIMLSVLPVVSC